MLLSQRKQRAMEVVDATIILVFWCHISGSKPESGHPPRCPVASSEYLFPRTK